jgi:iron-sulfur cluster repair protein YtfE (RIC family)
MARQDDAVTLLDEDHNEAIRLFEQFKAARDANRQRLVARQICQELLVHMQIEEEIFYPAYAAATSDRDVLQDGYKEHREARELIHQLEQDPSNAKLMLELEDGILHHVNDEREKMFPKARKANMDLAELAQRLEARKTELLADQAA